VAFELLCKLRKQNSNEKEKSMTNYTKPLFRSTLALLAAACFIVISPPGKASANTIEDSQEISKILSDAKSEAVELRDDAERMEAFTRSKLSWHSLAVKLDEIKEHVNKSGRLLAKLQDVRETGSLWQQQAIDHITPALTELAANTTATIEHLNANRTPVHRKALENYCNVNYRLAKELAALVGDFVDYGEAKATFAELQSKVDAR
jgi:hypothetical protein